MSSSSSAPDLGDAVRPDGTLKDASEINWAFDADESIPFPAGQNAGDHTASSGSHAPDVMGDSIRRTTRLRRPSRRVLDALDAEAACPRPRTTKRKPPQDIPSRRVSRKVVIDVDDDDGNDAGDSDNDDDDDSDGDSDNGIATEPASEAMSEEYDTLRAMADADNQVCPSTAPTFVRTLIYVTFQAATFKSKEARTADIRLMFVRQKNYLHPDTGKLLDGHWCTTCR